MKGMDARTRYALLAALDLAEHAGPSRPAKVREIAARTGVPAKYLVHILLALKRRALIHSARGAKGGYWLVKPTHLTSVAEVVAAAGAHDRPTRRTPPQDGRQRALTRVWEEAERRWRSYLAQVTLSNLLEDSPPS